MIDLLKDRKSKNNWQRLGFIDTIKTHFAKKQSKSSVSMHSLLTAKNILTDLDHGWPPNQKKVKKKKSYFEMQVLYASLIWNHTECVCFHSSYTFKWIVWQYRNHVVPLQRVANLFTNITHIVRLALYANELGSK